MQTKSHKVLSIILAGGEGKRLMPLTADRAKPAVPFGGVYRLIDFPLSNCVNSGYRQIVTLTQYKSQSLDRHIAKTWSLSARLGEFVSTVPAQQRTGKHWYLGSADAIYQTLEIIDDEDPDIILILGADHVYRMDYSQMVKSHIKSGAEFTVSAIRQPLSIASEMGVIQTDAKSPDKISGWVEKPESTPGLPDSPNEFYASMGNYVANRDALYEALKKDAENPDSKHDMGGDIVPYFVARDSAGVYDFQRNVIPGETPRDKSYWRDVGSIDQFYESNIDLIQINPIFNLYNRKWPIFANESGFPPAKFVSSHGSFHGIAENSIVSPGVIVSGGNIESSIISPNVRIHSGAKIFDSIVMDNCEIGKHSIVKNAILDKNVHIADEASVGVDLEKDKSRGLFVTESGITVIPKGTSITK